MPWRSRPGREYGRRWPARCNDGHRCSILDEATSALDATRQRAIHERIRKHGSGQTVIKLAHRLETVVDADGIVVLDDGRPVEQGTHAEMLERGAVRAPLRRPDRAPA